MTEQSKDYTESQTLWRRIFLIGCIQHDMFALCEPVIILYGPIPVTLAAWSLSFSSAAGSQSLIASGGGEKTPRASSSTWRRPSGVVAHSSTSELRARQMAPGGVIAHWRSHRAPEQPMTLRIVRCTHAVRE